MGIPERAERGKRTQVFETIITEFLQVNFKHQIIDPGSSENTKQDK